ncbi:MAG TPA: sigma-E processing peptidase SpoIIGA, partial [Clostridia bacterium]|nr:sigma-E processing peptidase SpoIIGA [Clostridia bacterium]
MNLAVLVLSAALSGFRLSMPAAFAASLSGAVFALLAVSSCPVLTKLLPKLLFALVLALGLKFSNFAGYLRSLLCVLLSAMLLGGLMLILVHLQTNEVKSAFVGGVLLGSVEIRLLLLTVAFAAVLPRCLRYLRNITRIDTNKIPLKVIVDGYSLSTTALIDS